MVLNMAKKKYYVNIIINIVYFHFASSKRLKQRFHELLCWMTKIPFLHMNPIVLLKYCESVCIGQYVVKKMYSYICLRKFPVLWHFGKKTNENHKYYPSKMFWVFLAYSNKLLKCFGNFSLTYVGIFPHMTELGLLFLLLIEKKMKLLYACTIYMN